MAYSYVRYSGNGSTTNYTFSFPTISQDHIKVRVNGTLVTNWSFLSSSTIQFATAPANAAVIEIRRETPKDSSIVNFTDGSVLLERDLDLLATWQLYVAQETEDDLEDTIRTDSQGRFDANNKRIINVADPVNAQDAVTKTWAETAMSSQLAQATSQATAAAGSATAAAGSANAAATSAGNASTSESNAASSASSASNSATAADGSATAAANSATAAGTSATNANTSAVAAASSASTATTQATNASASAVSAANSAAAAATALDNFDDRYLGQKANDPSVDNDGNALVTGALYYNSTDGAMRVYTGTGWINASSAQVATLRTYVHVATAGQTVFTGTDANSNTLTFTAPYLIVSLNGLQLRSTVDYTTTGNGTITLVSGASAGDELQVQAFANFNVANIQSADVTFTQSGAGAVVRNTQIKMRETLTPKDFGAVGDGVTNDDTALALFLAEAVSRGTSIHLTGTYAVTKLVIPTGITHIYGDFTLIGASSGTYSCVLEIKNMTDLTVDGRIGVSASYNTGYAAAIKVWSDNGSGCSLLDLKGVVVGNALIGWQFGDLSQPDSLISEITVSGGHTWGCPTACLAIGTQTVVSFVGYVLQSSYGNGSSTWQALPQKTIISTGGQVNVAGGELLHPQSTSGSTVESRPITSAAGYANSYGSVKCVNVLIETAAPLVITANPLSVASPSKGELSFLQCTGYHAQDVAPFITTDSQFTGMVSMQLCDFYAAIPRTQPNILSLGLAHFWIDDKSFGKNFSSAIGSITGSGVLHFSQRLIFSANSLSGQSLPNATATDLRFQSVDNTGDLNRFSSNYSASTGVFTVPAGGLKNVQIVTNIFVSGFTIGELYLWINGAVMGYYKATNGGAYITYNTASLAAGTTIKVTLFNIASGSLTAATSNRDVFQIFASN